MKLLKEFIKTLVQEEILEEEPLEEVNAIAGGAVGFPPNQPLGMDKKVIHKALWDKEANKPLKTGSSLKESPRYDTKNSSGKLNKEFARKFYELQKNNKYMVYNPIGGTAETLPDSGFLEPRSDLRFKQNEFVAIDTARKQIITIFSAFNPILIKQLKSLAEIFPEFSDWPIHKLESYEIEPVGLTLAQVLSRVKPVSVKSKPFTGRKKEWEDEKEPTFEEFKYEVLQHIDETNWYHATRKSNWNAIKRAGLLPSQTMPQGHGWTEINFDLQNAVYLTKDKERAERIASVLVNRFEEDAIIIEVSGKALSDTTKLVVDEDALRNDLDGSLTKNTHHHMPAFLSSVIHRIEGIGYGGIIPAQFLKIVDRIVYEKEKPEEDNSY